MIKCNNYLLNNLFGKRIPYAINIYLTKELYLFVNNWLSLQVIIKLLYN